MGFGLGKSIPHCARPCDDRGRAYRCRGAGHRSIRACGRPAASRVVLRGQRDLSLSRPIPGGSALRPRRSARCRLVADRLGGGRLRDLAPAVADLARCIECPPTAVRRTGCCPGPDELTVLPRGGAASALHGRSGGVSRDRHPGRARCPHSAQCRGADHRGHRRRRADQRPTLRRAVGIRVRLRQLSVLRRVRDLGPSDREYVWSSASRC